MEGNISFHWEEFEHYKSGLLEDRKSKKKKKKGEEIDINYKYVPPDSFTETALGSDRKYMR